MILTILCVILALGPSGVTMDTAVLYPYGDAAGDTDEGTKILPYTFSLSSTRHKPWGQKISQFTVYPADGFMERENIKVRYWAGGLADMAANPGTHQYYRRTADSDVVQRVKDDVIATFGDVHPHNQFTPDEIDIITFTNFTHSGGNETSKTNTVQFVTTYNSDHVYWMLNFGNIGWWMVNEEYPQVGIADESIEGFSSDMGIRYDILGSGKPEIKNTLMKGNCNVTGRWIFYLSRAPFPNLVEMPTCYFVGNMANLNVSESTILCKPGYTGPICESQIDACDNTCICEDRYTNTPQNPNAESSATGVISRSGFQFLLVVLCLSFVNSLLN